MTLDRDYLDALRLRALAVADFLRATLAAETEYPHVLLDNLRRARQEAAKIAIIVDAADVAEPVPSRLQSMHDIPSPPAARHGRHRHSGEGY